MIDQTLFVDVYSLTTKQKQRVPREWLDDPILGRDFRKTPSQRELDGELGKRPNSDNSVKEIDAWADQAEVDLTGVSGKDSKLVAIEDALGPAPVQEGLIPVEPDPVAPDPLAPERAARVDVPSAASAPASTDQTSGDTASPDETPSAGDKE